VRAEAEALRADNLALAERLKFVQGYGASGAGGTRRSVTGSASAGAAAADVEAGLVVGRYMAQYEQSINPFAGGRASLGAAAWAN
jgi:hypothetical protein